MDGVDRSHGAAGVFLRGMLMGAADIVPGVSGGTMAFITGIYDRLLAAIAAFDLELFGLLRRGDFGAIWTRVDGSFLAALLAGILLSVLSLARGISHLLETQPLLLWSFFFGLIGASAVLLLRHVEHWRGATISGLLVGTAFVVFVGLSPAMALNPSLPGFFLAGLVAICAMILPGISGSFILVLLGMYSPVLAAIRTFDLLPLLVLAVGAAGGLLVFSRFLNYLLARHHSATMATLTGFLTGSLLVVWPWKLPAAVGSELMRPALPGAYAKAVAEPQILGCAALMVLGLLVVWLLESRWGGAERQADER